MRVLSSASLLPDLAASAGFVVGFLAKSVSSFQFNLVVKFKNRRSRINTRSALPLIAVEVLCIDRCSTFS